MAAHQTVLTNDLQKITSEEQIQLQALKCWIEQQPHLRTRTDDQFLVQFLRNCKCNRENAQEKLDSYYALKTKFPEMFAAYDVDEPKFREVHNLGCFIALPKPLWGNGPRLVVLTFSYNPSQYNIEDIFVPGTALQELLFLHDSHTREHGIVYIADFANISASHLMHLTPSHCKKFAVYAEKSLPLYIKHAYFINSSTIAQKFFKILFPFISKDLRSRITIIGHDMQELAQHVPFEYLPADFGGQNSSCQEAAHEFNATWDLYREYFKENANFGSFDNLRLDKPMDLDDMLGINGSFRQLNED